MKVGNDITIPCDNGLVNLRVGAIIMKDGKFLMVGNKRPASYLYSVGGRIKFGETAEDAVIREVYEETGVHLEIDRLGFVHENFFYADESSRFGKLIYEISFFYYMKVPEDFSPVCESVTFDSAEEYLVWIAPDDPVTYYPDFFRTELTHPVREIKFFRTDDRNKTPVPKQN